MRIKNSIRNYSYSILGQSINLVLSFVCRTVFIKNLSVDYLGVGGLFTNILSLFSLADLGIGSAIIVYLYKPLANNDEAKLKSLTHLYAKAYQIIGISVAILGLLLLPFINHLIKEPPEVDHLYLIYLLFVANSTVSYFFSYKRALITADQKEYISTNNSFGFLFLQYLIQIVVLVTSHNYLLYLSTAVCCTIASNISISIKANKLYPLLKDKNPPLLERTERKNILKNVLAMMSHKIGGVANNSADNILISAFIGIASVGIYSNYLMIQSVVNGFVMQIFNSVSASIGNLNETESDEKVIQIYNVLLFISFWVFGFCAICLIILFNPFIKAWIGEEYLLNRYVIMVIVTNFYLAGNSRVTTNYVNVTKLFWNTKLKPWAEIFIKVVVSVLLIKKLGLIGVFIGTSISFLSMTFWVDPYVLYKHRFRLPVISYYTKYIINTLIIATVGLITFFFCNLTSSIFVKFAICAFIPNLMFFAVFHRTKEYVYVYKSIKAICRTYSMKRI